MFREKINTIIKELLSFSGVEKLFIISAMICGFCITSEYAIIRPVSNSVFIHSYGASFFPFAWLAVLPLNFLVVALYNRYLPKLGCFKMFLSIFALVAGGNLFCALFLKKISCLPFIFYIWKEVYIMLMFQQLWSVIHSTITEQRAKYLYGILFAVGGAGGALGSTIPGFLAIKLGSESLLFLSIPIYLVLGVFFYLLVKNSMLIRGTSDLKSRPMETGSIIKSFRMIGSSKFLKFILLIVIFMQLSSSLIDFQFNTILENTIADKDARTEYTGRLLGLMNIITVSLQVFGAFLLVHFLGLKGSHYFVPLFLCTNAIGFLIFPQFGTIALSYITIKAFDFSIFGVVKEMLYIPLKLDEKFSAKAIIDVFAYRAAKAFGAFLILFLNSFSKIDIISFLTGSVIIIFLIWWWIVFRMFKEYRTPAEIGA